MTKSDRLKVWWRKLVLLEFCLRLHVTGFVKELVSMFNLWGEGLIVLAIT
jgi:hypothetical protein